MTDGVVEEQASSARIWAAVLFLMLVGVLNTIDRILPSVLVEPIKHDLALSDTMIGLINGFGFLIVYAAIGIPIARLSDRGRYGVIIAASLAFWSAMTLLGAATRNGWQLASTRVGVAIGEAGSAPAAQAFISRSFPPARRSAPLAILSLAVPLAILGANIGGSFAGEMLGWRTTFAIMGAIGLLLAPFALIIVPDDVKGGRGSQAMFSGRQLLHLFRKPSFVLLLAGSSFVGIGGYALTTFAFSFLMRVHHLRLAEVGLRYGLAVGGIGIIGLLATAVTADRLTTRDARGALWVVSAVIAAVVPFSYAALVVTSETAVLICLASANIVAIVYVAPVIGALHRLVPPSARATASAILLLCMALFGGVGPFLTGVISDALQQRMGASALARALMIVPAAQALAAICYGLASLTFRRDMAATGPAAGRLFEAGPAGANDASSGVVRAD